MKVLKNPGPQWDRAAAKLAALCAERDRIALQIAASCPTDAATACRYHAGDNTAAGRLVADLEKLVYWDETEVDDGRVCTLPTNYNPAAVRSAGGDITDVCGGGWSKID